MNVRKKFPIFNQQNKQPLVYLDSAATSQKPQEMIDAISKFYGTAYATVHRSLYAQGEMATTTYEKIRAQTATFIGADTSEVIFTKGSTEGINAIANTWAKQMLKPGDEILLTQVEHHANLVPWQQVAAQTGAVLKFVPLNRTTFTLDYHDGLITPKTKIVAVMHTSNVLGNVWTPGDLERLITKAHEQGAYVLIDAAQAVAHTPLNVAQLNPDFLVFSTHKVYGPSGLGVLYIKKDLHKTINPYSFGGSMVYNVTYTSATWAQAPQKFEAGTPPIAAVIGWGATMDYLATLDRTQIHQHEIELCKYLVEKLTSIENLSIMGNLERIRQEGFLVSFFIKGIHAHDVASYLATKNIAIRAGHHCAQPLIDFLGGEPLLRISIGMYNTIEDIDATIVAIKEAITTLNHE